MPASPTSAAKGNTKIKPIGQTSGKHFGTDDRKTQVGRSSTRRLPVPDLGGRDGNDDEPAGRR